MEAHDVTIVRPLRTDYLNDISVVRLSAVYSRSFDEYTCNKSSVLRRISRGEQSSPHSLPWPPNGFNCNINSTRPPLHECSAFMAVLSALRATITTISLIAICPLERFPFRASLSQSTRPTPCLYSHRQTIITLAIHYQHY